jgi:hypothetical protein
MFNCSLYVETGILSRSCLTIPDLFSIEYLSRDFWERSKDITSNENTRDPLTRGGQAKHVHNNWLGSGSFPMTNRACFFFFFLDKETLIGAPSPFTEARLGRQYRISCTEVTQNYDQSLTFSKQNSVKIANL